MKTVAFVNLKGGSGKTTLAALFASIASRLGFRVLAVDLDPQASLTAVFLKRFEHGYDRTSLALITEAMAYNKPIDLDSAVVRVEHGWLKLDLLPSHPRSYEMYFRAQVAYVGTRALELLTKAASEKGYDLVVVDSPPDPIFTNYALNSADFIVVPSDPTPIGIYTARLFVEMFGRGCVQEWFLSRPKLLAIIGNKVPFVKGRPSEADIRKFNPVVKEVLALREDCVCKATVAPGVYTYLPRSKSILGNISYYMRKVGTPPVVKAVEWLEKWSKGKEVNVYEDLASLVKTAAEGACDTGSASE